MTAQEFTLTLPELRIAAKRWRTPTVPEEAQGNAITVLALHGWLDNANSFDRLAPALLARVPQGRHLEIVAVDLPGHGLSDHRTEGPYHFIDAVADTIAIANALNWERFSLLGHSMGGGIATLIAGTLPERIEKLALVEALGPLSETAANTPKRFAQSIALETKKRSGKKRLYETHKSAAEQLVFATGMQLDSAMILVERGLRRLEGGFSWRADNRLRLRSRLRLGEEQVEAFVRAIACPVLLMTGSEGYDRERLALAPRAKLIGKLQWEDFVGSHHIHLDRADDLADKLAPFLFTTETTA